MTIFALTLMSAMVRRDMHATARVTVPEHELPVLKTMYGNENIFDVTPTAVTVELDATTEYKRLSDKYNGEVIEAVYGSEHAGRLGELMERAAEKPAAKGKAKKSATEQSAGEDGKSE